MRNLEGRVAIVTGGGRGIGRSHCLELARQGASVVVNDLGVALDGSDESENPADVVVSEIEAIGGSAITSRASVTDWEAVRDLIAQTVAQFGRLDILVNNAGIVRDRMITSMSEADFDAVIDVHLKGTFAATKHACDHWRTVVKAGGEVSGRIINTTSGTGLFGNIGQSAYGAAKAGIANLTMITAMEMGRYAVTANAVSPLASTRMLATSRLHDVTTSGGEWDPLDPGNSSPVVAWLASIDSGWLTGAVLRVTGNAVQPMQPWDVKVGDTLSGKPGQRLEADQLGVSIRQMYGVTPKGLPPVAVSGS